MDAYDGKQDAYEAEVDRMRATYGQDAEAPHDPGLRGAVGIGVPVMTPAGRIAELAKQVAESGHMLAEARSRARESNEHLMKCESAFTQVSEAMVKAIHDHREGTPENVPYARGLR